MNDYLEELQKRLTHQRLAKRELELSFWFAKHARPVCGRTRPGRPARPACRVIGAGRWQNGFCLN